MVPVRIQRSRQHKQVSPNGLPVKYCGRGTKWGNPFRVVKIGKRYSVKCSASKREGEILVCNCRFSYDTKEEAAKDAVICYKELWLPHRNYPDIQEFIDFSHNLDEIRKELKGFNLSCWCKPGETCHVDFLLEIANS